MLSLEVWDVTGNKRVTVEVPEDVPVERIMVVLVERLMLPKYSPQGDFMSYKFHHRRLGVQLFDDQSLDQQQVVDGRSEEHTSELQSPYVISYAVFCLKK